MAVLSPRDKSDNWCDPEKQKPKVVQTNKEIEDFAFRWTHNEKVTQKKLMLPLFSGVESKELSVIFHWNPENLQFETLTRG